MKRLRKRTAICLFIVALALFVAQAMIWARSAPHARSETDKQNVIGHDQPDEIPGVAGMCLLVLAAVIVSIPLSYSSDKNHHYHRVPN
jgi:hypothetical protein